MHLSKNIDLYTLHWLWKKNKLVDKSCHIYAKLLATIVKRQITKLNFALGIH